MVRLPTPGGDTGTWGTLLDTFLDVVHNSDGTLKSFYSITDFGAVGDGITDNTTAITNALSAVNTAGGGWLVFPPGTYLTGPQTIYSKVHLLGAGVGATILKLKSGSNGDLLSANTSYINLSAAFGASNTGGIEMWSIARMTLDGNKAGQTGGPSYCMRFYGYAFFLEDLNIINGYTGGVLCDWNGGATSPDYTTIDNTSQWLNVRIHDCNGVGLQMGGPHDSMFLNVTIYDTGTHNLHLAPNAVGMQFTNLDVYGCGSGDVAILNEASSCIFVNSQAAGSDTMQVVLAGLNNHWHAGRVFTNTPGTTCGGLQIGQAAGNTPYNGAILQSAGVTLASAASGITVTTSIKNCDGSKGSVYFENDGGGNTIKARITNTSGGAATYTSGSRASTTNFEFNGTGLTADGTLGKSGGSRFNGVDLRNGAVIVTKSASVASLSNGSTITTLGVGMARTTNSGVVTGIILQSGSVDGQMVRVVNKGSGSITFAASGTSHVGGGAGIVIAAGDGKSFEYDTTDGLWW